MEVNVHDLIKICHEQEIISDNTVPSWVNDAIRKNPYVIVRRAFSPAPYIPIGIRGEKRNERFAAYVRESEQLQIIHPEFFIYEELWRDKKGTIFKHLHTIREIMENEGVVWGIIGSVAYELVTNTPCTTDSSDIDLIVRYTPQLSMERCKRIIEKCNDIPIKIDVQIEFDRKACSMKEYVQNNQEAILFKTDVGPVLEYVELPENNER